MLKWAKLKKKYKKHCQFIIPQCLIFVSAVQQLFARNLGPSSYVYFSAQNLLKSTVCSRNTAVCAVACVWSNYKKSTKPLQRLLACYSIRFVLFVVALNDPIHLYIDNSHLGTAHFLYMFFFFFKNNVITRCPRGHYDLHFLYLLFIFCN